MLGNPRDLVCHGNNVITALVDDCHVDFTVMTMRASDWIWLSASVVELKSINRILLYGDTPIVSLRKSN